MSTECPPQQQLAMLAERRLPSMDLLTLQHHLDGCRDCREMLAQLTPGAKRAADPLALARTVDQLSEPSVTSESKPAGTFAPPTGAARYANRRELGRGSMGRVVEANDRQFGRVVAVKEMLQPQAGELGRRFLLEALVTANLEHPGIAAVYERGVREDGVPFYVMKRIRGATLAQSLQDATSLPERLKLLPVVIRVAQTLAYAHSRGVIHRDIKPENILVGDFGETVVLDWGIAKVQGLQQLDHGGAQGIDLPQSKSTMIGSVLGTPAYMAPEQASGRVDEVDERTDVFALGAILYHVLVGRPPYEGSSVEQTIERAAAGEFPPIGSISRGAPPALVVICERALARMPQTRFRSAADLATALEQATLVAIRESPYVQWFAVGTSGLVALALVAMLVRMISWSFIPSLAELGPGAVSFFTLAVVGCTLSIIEWRTGGRHTLTPLVLVFALSTLVMGIVQCAFGLGNLTAQLNHVVNDAVAYRRGYANGIYGSIGSISVSGVLATLQVVLWGLLQRRVLRAQQSSKSGRA